MSKDQIPTTIWSGTFRIWGIDLRCSMLDNGQRVIDAEDVARLFAAMDDKAPRSEADDDAFAAFMRWYRG
jgi:hypothetical protein